jgi:hypothetical protein
MQPGRNDPCPCGSGLKYKKCCGQQADASSTANHVRVDTIKNAALKLDERLFRYATLRLGEDWLSDAIAGYVGETEAAMHEAEEQFVVPWAMHHWRNPRLRASLAEYFHETEGDRLPSDLRRMLDAQLHSWLGIWDVTQIDEGRGFRAVDHLTKQERFVYERRGTESLTVRDSILAWVVDCDGITIIGGMHPFGLGPRDVDPIVHDIRRLCRVRTRPASLDVLARPMIQSEMIGQWRTEVEYLSNRPLPRLANTDGDPFSPTSDYFDIVTEDMSALLASISEMPGVAESQPRNNRRAFVVTKKGNPRMKELDNTMIATIMFHDKRLCIETNSTTRADNMRKLVVRHLRGLVRYRIREEMGSSEMLLEGAMAPRSEPKVIDDPEATRLMRDFRQRHMIGWLDESIPMLGGLTPREAIMTKRGMKEVDLLLRDFEHHEAKLPVDERIDIKLLRIALGLEL